MKRAFCDSSDFTKIIRDGNIYVDKTELLHRLVSGDYGSRFFISRPRRFGKSLMLSTLKAIFQGKRELFTGLAISSKDYNWRDCPVLHIDMSSVQTDDLSELKQNIVGMVYGLARENDLTIDLSIYTTPSACFGGLLGEMYRKYGQALVVLVDEYDAPVNRMIESGEEAKAVNSVLHDFYMQLKAHDSKIHFLMMTGVSKFAKLSVFSGLNNLQDLTLEPEFAALLGYTPDEIDFYFSEHLKVFGDILGKTSAQTLSALLEWYDGYRFSPYSTIQVTNPVSLASALDRHRFEAFWDETGHSSLIYNYLKVHHVIPEELNGVVADKSDLDFCCLDDVDSPALLFQTGYLTIDKPLEGGRLKFKIPNKEISCALRSGMLSYIFKGQKERVVSRLRSARQSLEGDSASLKEILKETLEAAFNAIPYDWEIKNEPEARRMFLFYCNLMGAQILGEVHSSKGRADAVLLLQSAVIIFEFKYAQSAQKALEQAEKKLYAGPFMNDHRSIYLVGVNYDSKKRNIDEPCIKRLILESGGGARKSLD